MTINQLIKKHSSSNPTASFQKEAEILIARIIKKPREFVIAHPEKKLSQEQIKKINKLIKRLLENEPLAYILGHKDFYGLEFIVNKNVLIPRPETEMMVEKVLDLLSNKLRNKKYLCIDVGTGSGCIPISIIKNLSKNYKLETTNFFATDISKSALEVAKKNAKKHKASNQIKFNQSNLLEKFISNPKLLITGYRLLITANLPYLSEKIYDEAPRSVTSFEPKQALLSGQDGLDHYRKLLDQIKIINKNSSELKITAFVEISPEQKNLIKKEILQRFPDSKIKFHKDLAKKWRLVEIILK